MDKICNVCNKVLSESVVFCPECGAAWGEGTVPAHQNSQPQTAEQAQTFASTVKPPTLAPSPVPPPMKTIYTPQSQNRQWGEGTVLAPQNAHQQTTELPQSFAPSVTSSPTAPPMGTAYKTQPQNAHLQIIEQPQTFASTAPPPSTLQPQTAPPQTSPPIGATYTPQPQTPHQQTVRQQPQPVSPRTYTQPPVAQPYVPYQHPPQATKKSSKLPMIVGILGGAVGVVILLIILIVAFTPDGGGRTDRDLNSLGNNRDGTTIAEQQIPVAPPNLAELSPEQIFADNVDAVFILYTYDANWNALGSGSGFFISRCGIAVTNHHVVVGARNALIITEGGDEFYVGGFYSYDIGNDLAVIRVNAGGTNFSYLYIGDSEAIRVGESVYAIGSPHGHQNTFSISYVSSIVSEVFFDIYAIEGVIQITAPIYAGSSGGALLNSRGEVIGVTTAIDPRRANIGFAVPSSRIDLSAAERGQLLTLPIGDHMQIPGEDEIFYYVRFPSIPDFQSVSATATLVIGGSAEDMDFSVGEEFDFEYVYLYELAERHFVPDTDIYDVILGEHGFVMQTIQVIETRTYVYLYNSEQDVSLVYTYLWDIETFLVAIGQGNAFEQLFAGYVDREGEVSSLLGGWYSDGFELHYFSDGTGSARFFIAGTDTLDYEEDFRWISEGPGVMTYINGPFAGTTWNYLVIGDRITFTEVGTDSIAILDRIS